MNRFLTRLYYDPANPAGFGTVEKLYTASTKAGKPYTRDQIENFLMKQDTYTLHKPQRVNFPTRKTVARGLHETHQTDLADFSKHAKHNDGYKFVLVVIDVLSKKAYGEAMKDKSNASVIRAFEAIYGDGKAPLPINLGSDRGTEYLGKPVQDYFKRQGINHYTLQNRQKAAVAERLIRTLKSKIYKYMDSKGSERFVDKLSAFMDAYNGTTHRSIKMAPSEVSLENAARVAHTLYGTVSSRNSAAKKPRYEVGDSVRISAFRYTFRKGYEQNYTDETFVVTRVLSTDPATYELKDYYGERLSGIFYGKELVKVVVEKNKRYRIEYVVREKRVKRKKMYLVKFRGYSRPEWVSDLGNL